MGRKRTKLSVSDSQRAKLIAQLDSVSDARARERLEMVLQAAGGRHTMDDIARIAGRARSTIQVWMDKYREGGVAKLLERDTPPGSTSPIGAARIQAQLKAGLKSGRWRSAAKVAAWLKKTHGIERSRKSLYYWFNKLEQDHPVDPNGAQNLAHRHTSQRMARRGHRGSQR